MIANRIQIFRTSSKLFTCNSPIQHSTLTSSIIQTISSEITVIRTFKPGFTNLFWIRTLNRDSPTCHINFLSFFWTCESVFIISVRFNNIITQSIFCTFMFKTRSIITKIILLLDYYFKYLNFETYRCVSKSFKKISI